ncbi:MAG: ribbon-helix-helix domain-containing protein [Actinomycetota bacterium]|nr:ribbon-helix-helix domain-containing protein [Actinomycetota bacterium]
MTAQLALRVPDELIRRLDALVPAPHASRSDAVRRAIELYLYRLECEDDARRYDERPLSNAELAFADDADAWSGTPRW